MVVIRTVAVIGAGHSGSRIACAAALGGYRTILEDILPGSLRRAETELHSCLEKHPPALERVEYAGTVAEAARAADLVFEAVPDELESKLEIFTLLDKICMPHTVLALTSPTLGVAEVASITYRPQKCIGIRFVEPHPAILRLELVCGPATDEETVGACMEAGRRMASEVILVDPD